MKRNGRWLVDVACDAQPDYNYYAVTFYSHGESEPIARVSARVYTNFGESAKEVFVDRLKPEALENVGDNELIEVAEVEVNSDEDFQEYVLFPGAMPNPFHKEHL